MMEEELSRRMEGTRRGGKVGCDRDPDRKRCSGGMGRSSLDRFRRWFRGRFHRMLRMMVLLRVRSATLLRSWNEDEIEIRCCLGRTGGKVRRRR